VCVKRFEGTRRRNCGAGGIACVRNLRCAGQLRDASPDPVCVGCRRQQAQILAVSGRRISTPVQTLVADSNRQAERRVRGIHLDGAQVLFDRRGFIPLAVQGLGQIERGRVIIGEDLLGLTVPAIASSHRSSSASARARLKW